jgi:hypothetical protein
MAIRGCAFGFAATYGTLPALRAAGFGDDGPLPLSVIVVVKVDDDPVMRPAEFVRTRGVRVKRREVPSVATCVQHREPGFAFWIEPPRGDDGQAMGGRRLAILAIDVE